VRLRVLYHLPILPPRIPACEAISQEISALCRHVDGEIVYVNPNRRSPFHMPRLLFGFHRLRWLRGQETTLHLHHFYNPDPFPFPYLRLLRQPVVYSLTGGVVRRPNVPFFTQMDAVTVMDEESLARLQEWGLRNVFLVRPGIDTSRFTHTPLPLRSEIRLMVGSAPWTKGQFRTKGVMALLEAARQEPRLHLIFLWRGVLAEEMTRRIRKMGVEDRVTVLNRQVDVNRLLARVHAAIALASTPTIVKAYPHSLLESLAAGKPVLVSRAIPMARYVENTGCGVVVEEVSATGVLTAVASLAETYEARRRAALGVGRETFSVDRMISSFRRVYEGVLGRGM